jgi:outer membrane protein assembly factor BamB
VKLILSSRSWLFLFVVLCLPLAGSVATGQEKGIGDFAKLSAQSDWPWWRGPTRNGFASNAPVPTVISDTENLVWKVSVPGRGHSSPTVVGNRIFLTTSDTDKQIHSIMAFDRGTGKTLWQVEASRGGFPEKNHPKNTEATATIASDGERVFATFYHHDKVEAVALDLDGKEKWRRDVGQFRPRRYEYGYAPSPMIYRNTVIISAEYDGDSFIAALDRTTGEPVWKTTRPNNITFSSPVVTSIQGKDELLISGAEKVSAYDPANGKPLWSVPGTTFATCGTMVWDGGIVFASGGYPKAETLAINPVSHEVLWRNNQKCYEQSMLAYKGYLYALTDNGLAICWRGTDGNEMWKMRLKGPVSASPVLANDHIYWANELGTLYVIRANPERFELVAENTVGNDSFPSPAICGGQIFLRVGQNSNGGRQEWLYCFGNATPKTASK